MHNSIIALMNYSISTNFVGVGVEQVNDTQKIIWGAKQETTIDDFFQSAQLLVYNFNYIFFS